MYLFYAQQLDTTCYTQYTPSRVIEIDPVRGWGFSQFDGYTAHHYHNIIVYQVVCTFLFMHYRDFFFLLLFIFMHVCDIYVGSVIYVLYFILLCMPVIYLLFSCCFAWFLNVCMICDNFVWNLIKVCLRSVSRPFCFRFVFYFFFFFFSSYSSSLPPTALHDFSAIYHPIFLKVGQMIDNDW